VTVIGNLIDNAIDASAEAATGKRVTVMVRPDADDLVIQVTDTGPGLSDDLVDSAFTRGWSTKNATDPAGRGLGLALVNQVVRRHRGTVDVTAAPGGGAVFTARLPLHRLVEVPT
jgi:two-component system CitB family sensor kinase